MLKTKIRIVLLSLTLMLSACVRTAPEATPTLVPATITPIPAPESTSTLVPDPPALPIDLTEVGPITPTVPINTLTVFGYTHQQQDGNRLVDGTGSVGSRNPVDIALNGKPSWVVGVPVDGGGSIWSIVFEDGRVQSIMQLADTIMPIEVQPSRLPAGMPPLMIIHRGAPRLLSPPEDASILTHPIVIAGDPANTAYVANNGDLVVNLGGEVTRLAVNALPDARILQDEKGRLLLLTGATGRYAHGVLGDAIEAGSITLVNTNPAAVASVIDVSPRVVEGVSPIWVDFDGDGQREIIVTLSDESLGGQIAIYSETGEILGKGPEIGRGFRWRHQLVVAPFEPGLPPMLADNLTPHIGGVTEFYTYNVDEGLTLLTGAKGFSSHRIGSRNLDMAIAGDFDGDGVIELLVPSETGDFLGAFQVRNGFALVSWTIRIPSPLSTNLAAVTLLNGKIALAAGFENGILRLWLP